MLIFSIRGGEDIVFAAIPDFKTFAYVRDRHWEIAHGDIRPSHLRDALVTKRYDRLYRKGSAGK